MDKKDPVSPIAVAGIHATIITIFITIASAYAIFTAGIVKEMEMQALKEAEKINKIQFARSYYLPNLDEFSMPKGHEDIKYVTEDLVIYFLLLVSAKRGGKSYESGKFIPRDPAERAEKALQIMNIIVHRYPFPKAIEKTSLFRPEPIYFNNINVVRQWLTDMKKVVNPLSFLTYLISTFYPDKPTKYLQALAIKKKKDLEQWNTNTVLQILGHIDPIFLWKDFLTNLQKVDDILESTNYYLNRVDIFRQGLLSRWSMIIGLICAGISFFSGVIIPLFNAKVSQLFLLWIPICFYAMVFGYIFYQLTFNP